MCGLYREEGASSARSVERDMESTRRGFVDVGFAGCC